jgi:hypothetical protein
MTILDRFTTRQSRERRLLPSGLMVELPARTVRFPTAVPPKLPAGITFYGEPDRAIPKSYLDKPLVEVDGRAAFGELAIRHCIERDEEGWDGVWVDTYHSRGASRLFWRDLPDRSLPIDLAAYPAAYDAYRRVFDRNRGGGGFFDVLAWQGDFVVFMEYKGEGDSPNKNEARWIESAMAEGFDDRSLSFVLC